MQTKRNSSLTSRTLLPLILCLGVPALAAPAPTLQRGAPASKPIHILRLKGTYLEHPDVGAIDPMSLLTGAPTSPKSFFKLCDYIDGLAAEEDVQDVLFDLSAPELSMNGAQLSELSRHMRGLQEAGKQTWAWIENASSVHYSIASNCKTVVMSDFGTLDLPSISMGSMHFKDAFDLLGVKASTTRVGEYKGATEPFTKSHMSDHLRAHYHAMLTSMNDEFVGRVAANRGLTAEQLRAVQAQRLVLASQALEAGLVDALAPLGGAGDKLEELAGGSVRWIEREKKGPRSMSFFELMGELMGTKKGSRLRSPGIAILHLEGMIIDGSSRSAGMMVSTPIVEEISDLKQDPNVRGVVVRIDSPGGSATASESIRSALADLAQSKPIVYSMGSVAASGGYWISLTGRPVLAEAQTITGSIGVLALKLDMGELMGRIGVNIEAVELDSTAGMFAMNRPWSEGETAVIQAFCDDTYERFLQLASTSRSMSVEEVDAVAGGRVWSGLQAVELGLVDGIGGVEEAFAMLTKEAGLAPDCPSVHRPAHPSPLEALTKIGSHDEISFGLTPAILSWLQRSGLRLQAVRAILEAAMSPTAGPKAWLVSGHEIVIR